MENNYIKKVRTEKGLTQKELAKILQVTQGQISQWEQSETLTMSTLKKIAAALDCSITQLISEYTNLEYYTPNGEKRIDFFSGVNIDPHDLQEKAIFDAYGQLNDTGKEVALKRVEELTEIPRYRAKEEDL